MRARFLILMATLCAAASIAVASEPGRLELPDFSALAKKASQSVVISLDPSLLSLASGLFSADGDPADAGTKELISGLKGVYVRSFHFDDDDIYSQSDVDAVRAQLSAPAWQSLVSTHDRKQRSDVDIYVRRVGSHTEGLAIIAQHPRELTIVNIVGSIDLAKLSQLQGQFGIPRFDGKTSH
jgi:hypothetical protein